MSNQSRRGFLRRVVAGSGLLLLPGCDSVPRSGASPRDGSKPATRLDPELLRAVASDVLPTELGDHGLEAVVGRFEQWLGDYRPGVERDHAYLSPELSYTPEDPTPLWAGQLRELDEGGAPPYAQSAPSERRRRLMAAVRAVTAKPEAESAEPGESGLSLSTANAIVAPHLVLALLTFFFSSPEATDLCFRAQIRPLTCRELSSASARPA